MERQESLAGKRLLFVITKSNWGGAQAYVCTLAKHSQSLGMEVAVALGGTGRPGSDTGILAARLTEAGIRVHVVPALARDISPLHEWRALQALTAFIRSERPDILHLNSSKAGVLGAIAGRRARIGRIVFTVHGWPHREPCGAVMRAVRWLGSWLTVVLSHAVIAVSDCDRCTAPVIFSRKKIAVVRNGMGDFPTLEKEAARHFLAPDIPALAKLTSWVLIPAELTRNKGIDIAIRAFAGVSTNVDHAALVMVGEGEEHEHLTRLIESYGLGGRAFLLGFVPDVRRYLKAADIFLLPSRKEGLPLAVLEAGRAGLPAIATRTGGIPEIIEHQKTGLLINPGDVDALADAMTTLLTNPVDATKLGMALEQKVREEFSEKMMLDRTLLLYVK
ncbi:MAG TPA: glycosyltransferase family 4 protein [Candidatus Paceibacterota bacterium]|jgi:glycosyltransferase involved in cell wall biosynthesis